MHTRLAINVCAEVALHHSKRVYSARYYHRVAVLASVTCPCRGGGALDVSNHCLERGAEFVLLSGFSEGDFVGEGGGGALVAGGAVMEEVVEEAVEEGYFEGVEVGMGMFGIWHVLCGLVGWWVYEWCAVGEAVGG